MYICFLLVIAITQPDQIPGDVVVVLQLQDHPTFRREGPNLFMTKTITLLEALTGFSFPVQHLDGRTLLVKSDANMVVKPKDVKCIREEGMPQAKNAYVRGNLYIEFDVEFPTAKQLTESTKKVLKNCLPHPVSTAADAMSDSQPQEVTLVTVDMEAEKRKFEQQQHDAREAHDSDDENEYRRHPGQAQCRQQ